MRNIIFVEVQLAFEHFERKVGCIVLRAVIHDLAHGARIAELYLVKGHHRQKLTEKRREALFDEITRRALAYKIVFITPQEIDERNILWATMDGMAQAVAGLELRPDHVLIDGNRCPPGLVQTAESVVKGDANSASIAAASILAKVSRDRYMLELDKQYPQYQLAKHKGYPTKLHYELIARYGIQPFYRRSFLKKQGYWDD